MKSRSHGISVKIEVLTSVFGSDVVSIRAEEENIKSDEMEDWRHGTWSRLDNGKKISWSVM